MSTLRERALALFEAMDRVAEEVEAIDFPHSDLARNARALAEELRACLIPDLGLAPDDQPPARV